MPILIVSTPCSIRPAVIACSNILLVVLVSKPITTFPVLFKYLANDLPIFKASSELISEPITPLIPEVPKSFLFDII